MLQLFTIFCSSTKSIDLHTSAVTMQLMIAIQVESISLVVVLCIHMYHRFDLHICSNHLHSKVIKWQQL